jgi:hypothetical protein
MPKRFGTGIARQVQVAGLDQSDVGRVAFDREFGRDPAEECKARLRQCDVDRGGELLSDRTGRQAAGRSRVGRVAFQNKRAYAVRLRQEEGGRRRHHAAADDHDICRRIAAL